jgi:hypothetical protein
VVSKNLKIVLQWLVLNRGVLMAIDPAGLLLESESWCINCQPQHCAAGVTYDTACVLHVITNQWLEARTHYILY